MWRDDLEKRIKKLERSLMWNNIYLILLCAALSIASWHIWSVLIAQEAFNNEVLKAFKSLLGK